MHHDQLEKEPGFSLLGKDQCDLTADKLLVGAVVEMNGMEDEV